MPFFSGKIIHFIKNLKGTINSQEAELFAIRQKHGYKNVILFTT